MDKDKTTDTTHNDAEMTGIVVVDTTAIVDDAEGHQEIVIDIGVEVIEIVLEVANAKGIGVVVETEVVTTKGIDIDADQDIEMYCKI